MYIYLEEIGIRVDTAIFSGCNIPYNYDSLLAKIVTIGRSRNEAIAKMRRALEELNIDGIKTNKEFLLKIIKNSDFIRGKYDTSFIEKELLRIEEEKCI